MLCVKPSGPQNVTAHQVRDPFGFFDVSLRFVGAARLNAGDGLSIALRIRERDQRPAIVSSVRERDERFMAASVVESQPMQGHAAPERQVKHAFRASRIIFVFIVLIIGALEECSRRHLRRIAREDHLLRARQYSHGVLGPDLAGFVHQNQVRPEILGQRPRRIQRRQHQAWLKLRSQCRALGQDSAQGLRGPALAGLVQQRFRLPAQRRLLSSASGKIRQRAAIVAQPAHFLRSFAAGPLVFARAKARQMIVVRRVAPVPECRIFGQPLIDPASPPASAKPVLQLLQLAPVALAGRFHC